jgi:hypothetical protein
VNKTLPTRIPCVTLGDMLYWESSVFDAATCLTSMASQEATLQLGPGGHSAWAAQTSVHPPDPLSCQQSVSAIFPLLAPGTPADDARR